MVRTRHKALPVAGFATATRESTRDKTGQIDHEMNRLAFD